MSSRSSAIRILYRKHLTTGNRNSAVAALENIMQTSNLHTRARVEIARTLINSDRSAASNQELKAASVAIEALALEGSDRYRLTKQVLKTALNLITSRHLQATADLTMLFFL
ncbi:tetratricopeptide repeat protein [Nostoc sp. LPT]|uniref:tetratricopeptide repeat protein n=1 Tax=Nostoc sp. LPT TaxID=2815387 RepID=UPI0025CBEA29|nr:tetratricopeptide repeat protein [Nostoc sp. LPT]